MIQYDDTPDDLESVIDSQDFDTTTGNNDKLFDDMDITEVGCELLEVWAAI